MGACCGGGIVPETLPNIDKLPETHSAALIQQNQMNQSQISNVIPQNDEQKVKPITNTAHAVVKQQQSNHVTQQQNDADGCNNDNATTQKADLVSSVNNDVALKPSTHQLQRIASESTESTIITETLTRIIHDSMATNASLNTSISSVAPSVSNDAIVSDCKSVEHKLTALNETELTMDTNDDNKQFNPDTHEKRPIPTQKILAAYLLTRDDVQSWSNKQSDDDKSQLNHSEACTQSIDECESVQRLVFVIKLYNQCINHKDSEMSTQHILEYLHPHQDYQCLNDYFHFMDHHHCASIKKQNECKQSYFHKTCGSCDEYQCVAYIRNRRDRYKQTADRYYDSESTDYNLIAIQHILDSIHCAVFHSVLYENDKKRKEEILKQRHNNLYTINTGIDSHSTSSKTETKDDLMPELDENEQQQSSSSSTALKSQNKSIFKSAPNRSIKQEQWFMPYAFGHNHDLEFVLPTFSDLKHELLLNLNAPLTEYQWNIEDAKAKILKKTYKIHDDMTLDQIVALLVYCNYNALRESLLCSLTQKYKDYDHWAQLLFSAIKQFGETDLETYCELDFAYQFYSFNHFHFNGLFSTANDLSIVECSSTHLDGIILKLRASQFGVAPFIHLSLFSDFKDEPHQLFGFSDDSVLQIDTILTMEDISSVTERKHKPFIAALQLLEQIVIDTTYIDTDKQYEWLQNSLQQAAEIQDDCDVDTVVCILEYLLRECLQKDTKVEDKEAIELPAFIQTQFHFFRHCLRDNEFCTLCFDLKKMKLLPLSIQKLFMANDKISYGYWLRLFPNDRVLSIKNVDHKNYGSLINLFATFGIEFGDKYSDCLQCVDIDTNDTQYDENINDIIQQKNEKRFKKYSNWILSYERKQKHATYSIVIQKGQKTKVTENKSQNEDTVIVETVEARPQKQDTNVDDDDKKEEEPQQNGDIADIIMNSVKIKTENEAIDLEDEKGYKENITAKANAAEKGEMNEKNMNPYEVVPIDSGVDISNMNGDDFEYRTNSVSSIRVPSLNAEQVPDLLITVLTAVDEFKQSKENTPFSVGSIDAGMRTASPPFGNRWGFDSNTTTENESDAAAISDMDNK